MSKRRMFSQSIVESDAFLDMPLSTQALYLHLCINADDYGFVSPKRIMRMIGANDDDLKVLVMKRFVLGFDSGVAVIKHWQINNTVRKDRSHETTYQDEFKALTYNENGAYTEIGRLGKVAEEIATINKHIRTAVVENVQGQVEKSTTNEQILQGSATNGTQNDNQMATEIRLDKIRLEENRLDKTKKINKKSADKVDPKLIDQMLGDWMNIVGYEIDGMNNRKACAALLRLVGPDKLRQLIVGVAKSHDDQYAPRISDFVSLKRKMNDLILWGKRKGSNNATAQF